MRLLLSTAPPDRRAKIVAMRKDELISLHVQLGRWIRNNFGLLNGESPLRVATGAAHADDASVKIIEALRQQLHAFGQTGVDKRLDQRCGRVSSGALTSNPLPARR